MKIKWGSLYTVVQNLEKHGLIEESGSQREGRRPERTVYVITEAGREEVRDWLRELVAAPEPELHRFEAALSVLGVLPPEEVIELLEARLRALDESVARQQEALQRDERIPRLFLIEAEYALAMTQAEAAWVSGLRKELIDGSLAGIEQWREYHKTGKASGDWERLLEEQ
jgi:DNA-binding PadR family transcriptional regulator